MGKDPTQPYIGLPADELLKLRGRGQDSILKWPSNAWDNLDEEGLVVWWRYEDCTIELRHRRGRYRVYRILDKDAISPEEDEDAGERATDHRDRQGPAEKDS